MALFINKSQGMALSAGANITGLNHTLHATADNTISTLQAGSPKESTQNRDFNCLSRLTVVSREAKKKQHARASSGLRDHYSELFTRMAALKF